MNFNTNRLADYWWLLALRAVLALLFGLAAILWPDLTLAILVAIFGVFVMVDGGLLIAVGIRQRDGDPRWWSLLLQGVLGVAFGLVAFIAPIATAMALVILVGAWAIVTGMLEIAVAIRLRKLIDNEWFLAIGGVVSILFGLILAFVPWAGVIAMAWVIGGFAIVSSVLLFTIALRLRQIKSLEGDI